LAENWINIDDKTWIFNLRKNIYFSNQQPLTADDVIFSFERVKLEINSEANSDFGINLSFSKIEKINDYSIKIVTSNIFPTFLLKLRNCAILPKNYIEKNGMQYFLENPVGTGPYMNPKITESSGVKIVTLTRNDKYWGKKPNFKKVIFYLCNSQNILSLMKKEDFDLFVWFDQDFYTNFQDLKSYNKLSTCGLRTNFLILNCLDKKNDYIPLSFNPLANEFVRKAIYYAINTDEIAKKIFSDNSTSANQLVSPFVIGFNPKIPKQIQNIESAKKLLSLANLSGGFSMALHFSMQDKFFEKIALLLLEYLKAININLQLFKVDESEISKIRKEQNFSMVPFSLSSATGDALFIISTLIHSKKGSWGNYNFSGFSDKEIDELIEKVNEEFDEEKRIALYQKIMELTMNKVPYIPLYWPNVIALCKKNLKWQIRADERVYAFEMSY
jgi:peptide/nickel transport system substrate-binding protein